MADIDAADELLQQTIKARGGSGIVGIARNFRIIDVDKSGCLNQQEFARAMELFGMKFTKEETDGLFKKYDTDGSGTISTNEYLKGVRGAISKTRKALVNRIFASMDADGSGELTVEDVKMRYSAKDAPEVQAGTKTEEQVLSEFMQTFEGDGGEKGDGMITRQEWMDYYTGISSNVDSDDHFLLLICNVWNFPYAPLTKVQNLIKMMQTKVRSIQKGYESEEKTLIKQFKQIDSDQSGEVDMNEFKACMVNLGLYMGDEGDPEDRTAVELLFILFDEDASGALSYKEFATAALHYEF
jgi:Ca2+-binding EF-hand superfamily protein